MTETTLVYEEEHFEEGFIPGGPNPEYYARRRSNRPTNNWNPMNWFNRRPSRDNGPQQHSSYYEPQSRPRSSYGNQYDGQRSTDGYGSRQNQGRRRDDRERSEYYGSRRQHYPRNQTHQTPRNGDYSRYPNPEQNYYRDQSSQTRRSDYVDGTTQTSGSGSRRQDNGQRRRNNAQEDYTMSGGNGGSYTRQASRIDYPNPERRMIVPNRDRRWTRPWG